MKLIRNLICAAVGAVGLVGSLSAVASAQTVEQLQESGVVKVGVMVDYPPYGMMNAQGQPAGYDIEIAGLLAEKLGVQLELVPVLGVNRIPILLSNQADVLVASLTITPERAEKVDFSDSYATGELGLFAPVDVDITDAASLAGKSIAVARGSLQDPALTAVAPEGTDIRRFDDGTMAIQALLSGQVSGLAASPAALESLNQVRPDNFEWKFSLSDESNQQFYGVAIRKGNEPLLAYINEFLAEMKSSGKLEEVYEKWIKAPLPASLKQ